MKTIGIIAEFNPFHNGHAYLINEAKKRTNADRVVIIMSGNFVQRGEPAFIDKFSRTAAALESGADLVIELPTVYAISSASYFATGAIKMLDKLNVIDYLCFGCETDDLKLLTLISDIIIAEDDCYSSTLQSYLKNGFSFAKSRENAILKSISLRGLNIPASKIASVLNSPNAILGIEYITALKKCGSNIVPVPIKRSDAGYHDQSFRNEYASASAIRNLYAKPSVLSFNNIRETLLDVIPEKFVAALEDDYKIFYPITADDFSPLIGYELVRDRYYDLELDTLFDSTTDLSNRIRNYADSFTKTTSFVNNCNSPTYTSSRISRILFYLLFEYRKKHFEIFKNDDYVYYYRILGFNNSHAELLTEIKNHSSFPLLSKITKVDEILSINGKKMFAINLYADELYRIAAETKYGYNLPVEEQHEIIIVEH